MFPHSYANALIVSLNSRRLLRLADNPTSIRGGLSDVAFRSMEVTTTTAPVVVTLHIQEDRRDDRVSSNEMYAIPKEQVANPAA
jgi:hypothetical protein